MSDEANIDMEEELCLAVVYFLCSELSNAKKDAFKSKAEEIIAIYDSNVVFRKTYRFLNAYFYVAQGKPSPLPGGGLAPILKTILLAVGDEKEITIDNAGGGTILAQSSSAAVGVRVDGNKVIIKALDVVTDAIVTISCGSERTEIKVTAEISDGGIIP